MGLVFVWERLKGLTDSEHDGGGCVVVAGSIEEARALVPNRAADGVKADAIYVTTAEGPAVHIMPDAGCC